MARGDYVDDLVEDDLDEEDLEDTISGLVEVGRLTEVGAKQMRKAVKRMKGGSLPKPPFARSARDTERRAPAGFVEDGSGANFFTIPAGIGSVTTMRSKVSRVSHINRLLIIPSAPGAVIASIKVGDEEQTLQSGAPVELYGPSALTDVLPDNFSPLSSALDLVVVLQNTTLAAITGTIGFKASCKR